MKKRFVNSASRKKVKGTTRQGRRFTSSCTAGRTERSNKMKFHPLCEMFPIMSKPELKELADDIKANGQREAIRTFEGKIIDGRNRFLACEMAGVDPLLKEVMDPNPALLVRSLNLFRRHLNESQRAMLAAELMGSAQICANSDEAAKAVNVSARSVESAIKVKKKGVKSVQKAVRAGELKVSSAEKLAGLSKAEQRKAARGGAKSMKAKAASLSKPRARGGLAAEALRARDAEQAQPPATEPIADFRSLVSEAEGETPPMEVLALLAFAEDYRRYWSRRVSPHSSAPAPSAAEREMNDKVESLLAKHGAEVVVGK